MALPIPADSPSSSTTSGETFEFDTPSPSSSAATTPPFNCEQKPHHVIAPLNLNKHEDGAIQDTGITDTAVTGVEDLGYDADVDMTFSDDEGPIQEIIPKYLSKHTGPAQANDNEKARCRATCSKAEYDNNPTLDGAFSVGFGLKFEPNPSSLQKHYHISFGQVLRRDVEPSTYMAGTILIDVTDREYMDEKRKWGAKVFNFRDALNQGMKVSPIELGKSAWNLLVSSKKVDMSRECQIRSLQIGGRVLMEENLRLEQKVRALEAEIKIKRQQLLQLRQQLTNAEMLLQN